MRLQVGPQLFITQYRLGRPLIEYRMIFLIFAWGQPQHIVDDLRNGPMGRRRLGAERLVKLGVTSVQRRGRIPAGSDREPIANDGARRGGFLFAQDCPAAR